MQLAQDAVLGRFETLSGAARKIPAAWPGDMRDIVPQDGDDPVAGENGQLGPVKMGPFKTAGSRRSEQRWSRANEARDVARNSLLRRLVFRSFGQVSVQHGCPNFQQVVRSDT